MKQTSDDDEYLLVWWNRHGCGPCSCKLYKAFETQFANCDQAIHKAPKTNLMIPHLSYDGDVMQTFAADYRTTKNSY